MAITKNTILLFRNDTSENWETVNPILNKGEPAYDTTKKILKIGDGVTHWNDLDALNFVNNTNNSNDNSNNS